MPPVLPLLWRKFTSNKFTEDSKGMDIELLSFGYSRGIPQEADLVMDVRFLQNPYYLDELRDLNGTDPRVADYVMSDQASDGFLERFSDLLDHLIPLYHNGGKSYLTVAVGCTGGQHRSVAVVRELALRLRDRPFSISVRHRDIQL